jgi:ABC-2 type transport system permease protein
LIRIIDMLTIVFMIIGVISIFVGLFIMGAAFCFVTIQGLELRNIFTDGGREMAPYPMGIYKKSFLYFFTVIIPFSYVNV